MLNVSVCVCVLKGLNVLYCILSIKRGNKREKKLCPSCPTILDLSFLWDSCNLSFRFFQQKLTSFSMLQTLAPTKEWLENSDTLVKRSILLQFSLFVRLPVFAMAPLQPYLLLMHFKSALSSSRVHSPDSLSIHNDAPGIWLFFLYGSPCM